MTTTAAEYKDKGNKALVAGHFDEAVEMYTKAIELDASSAIFFANRAQAHIKSEAYGLAIADATEAVRLDPSYTKAFYRRAVANAAIIKYREAVDDFKKVVEQAPQDAQARARLAECQKLLRRQAFEKAIEVEDAPSVIESLDLTSMAVDAAYDGPQLEITYDSKAKADVAVNMTEAFIDQMVQRFRDGKLIPRKYVYAIVAAAMRVFKSEPTMVEAGVTAGDETMTVCGDTHGQFFDLLEIFRRNGKPSDKHMYLFNGDFVDRGSWSVEIALTLYAYKLLYPTRFFINRGNHETDNMNKVYGFEGECKAKFGTDKVFALFSESFSALPLASLISSKYLVLHGGLFSRDDVTLDDIRKVDRFAQRQPGQEGLMMEMLWTDPQDEPGRGPSKRGVGIQFGPDITQKFCENNGLDAVIRSHEVRQGGYSVEHNGRLITVFSAPNYCDSTGNLGAYINIGLDGALKYETFSAVPHPNVRPMAYASSLMG